MTSCSTLNQDISFIKLSRVHFFRFLSLTSVAVIVSLFTPRAVCAEELKSDQVQQIELQELKPDEVQPTPTKSETQESDDLYLSPNGKRVPLPSRYMLISRKHMSSFSFWDHMHMAGMWFGGFVFLGGSIASTALIIKMKNESNSRMDGRNESYDLISLVFTAMLSIGGSGLWYISYSGANEMEEKRKLAYETGIFRENYDEIQRQKPSKKNIKPVISRGLFGLLFEGSF